MLTQAACAELLCGTRHARAILVLLLVQLLALALACAALKRIEMHREAELQLPRLACVGA